MTTACLAFSSSHFTQCTFAHFGEASAANVDEFPCQMHGTAADTSGGAASALSCYFFYLVAVLLRFDSAFQRPLWADAKVFGTAGALKLGSNKASIPGPFDSDPKFIHGIVSR